MITEKIKEQIFAVRDSNAANMCDMAAVQREAFDRGFYELVLFIEENRDAAHCNVHNPSRVSLSHLWGRYEWIIPAVRGKMCTTKRETEETHMKNTKEAIRSLQKNGEYRFEGLGREESRKAATRLARAAMEDDRKNDIESSFGIARDAFGYYFAAQING